MNSEGYLRPKAEVLGDDSLIPCENQIQPAPNRFTHRLIDAQPFYFGSEDRSNAADGEFAAGTNVVLLRHDGGPRCRVADGRGLYVEISYRSLAELEQSQKG